MNAIMLVKWLEPVDSGLERQDFKKLSSMNSLVAYIIKIENLPTFSCKKKILSFNYVSYLYYSKISERPRVNYKLKFAEIYQALMCVSARNIMKEKIDLTKHRIVLRPCVHQVNLERQGIRGNLLRLVKAIVNP